MQGIAAREDYEQTWTISFDTAAADDERTSRLTCDTSSRGGKKESFDRRAASRVTATQGDKLCETFGSKSSSAQVCCRGREEEGAHVPICEKKHSSGVMFG